jgi:uncharacterized protein
VLILANNEVLEHKLEDLQKEYSKTKYNKATNKHLGILRKKIAEVKKEIVESGKGSKGKGFFVKKQGDATVALLGFPSAGKSSLINALTNTKSKTARYAFTTTNIVPGTMFYKDAHIQIFDMPGIIENAHLGVGGGRSVIAAARITELIALVVDIETTEQLEILLRELKALNININKRRPNISIEELTTNHGLTIEMNKSGLSNNELAMVFQSFGMHNAKIRVSEQLSIDDLISYVSGRSYYMRAIAVLNKIDLRKDYEKIAKDLQEKHKIRVIPVSALDETNIENLKDEIYNNLGIMTIYLKSKDESERVMPLIIKQNATVGEAASKLHTEILDQLKCAYVTGPSAKFRKQRVGITHILKHGDTITFIKSN